jgi:ABC-type transport system substrate-binding protein
MLAAMSKPGVRARPRSAAGRFSPVVLPRILLSALLIALLMALAAGCKQTPEWEKGKKILHYALRGKVDSLDPVRASSQYSGLAQAQIHETLYTYEYLKRPFELRPLLAAAMPEVSDDLLTYTIELKQGVRFHDDPCFEATGGEGREMVAMDVIYSLKRMADRTLAPSGWWLYQDRIVGLDEFKARMDARELSAPFDWDAPIEGLQAVDRYRVRITLERPFPQLLYILAMGYTAVVPRECTQYYGKEFGHHPVGTGPFRLRSWTRGSRVSYERNPTYREEYYPTEASPELAERGLLAAAGQRVPFLDGIVFHIYEQDQPMWLKFRVGDLDMVQVPAEYQEALYTREGTLRPNFVADGLQGYNLPLIDLVYRGFNMEDPIVGQGERARYLRQAISLATDTAEINDAFYYSTCVLYDGPIPPGLDGYQPGVTSPYRGPDLEKARELLARAGYPGGKGLPPIQYETTRGANNMEQSDMYARQLRRIGVNLQVNYNSFPELSQKLKRKKAQMFGLAWGADYPDAENFLQLFYGPNEAPGSNNFNYKNPEYDRLYETIRTMMPGPERTAIYQQMRQMIIDDVPAIASMARIRFYVWHRRVRNVQPSETWYRWFKYVDIIE